MKKVLKIREQLNQYMIDLNFNFSSAKNDYSIIRKCLTFGFFMNSAKKGTPF
jgi:hypothetical protein